MKIRSTKFFASSTNHRFIELQARAIFIFEQSQLEVRYAKYTSNLSGKDEFQGNNSEVAVDKVTENNEKAGGDAKSEVKGTKRPSESKGEDAKKQKKEENGEEDDVEDEEDVEGEEEEEEEELPEGEEELDEGEEEEEDDGEGEGEGEEDDEDA